MDDALLRREEELMSKNNFRKLLGIKVDSLEPGHAKLSMPITEMLLQPLGMVHGGVFSVLIDSAIGTAVRSVIDTDRQMAVTAEMNLNYIRGARQGTLHAEGKVVHQGKLLVVGTGDVRDDEGRLLATGRATYVILEGKTAK